MEIWIKPLLRCLSILNFHQFYSFYAILDHPRGKNANYPHKKRKDQESLPILFLSMCCLHSELIKFDSMRADQVASHQFGLDTKILVLKFLLPPEVLSFRIPYHFLHLLCKCMSRFLNVPIENLQWQGILKELLLKYQLIR